MQNAISSSYLDIENYDLIIMDRKRRQGGVACYVKKSFCYRHKYNFWRDIEQIFMDSFLPKRKNVISAT